ncbi:xylulokinase [Halopolyspora algeriensis]|nr:xylulokinase [Halopolyspora algeriensis]
MAIVLGIDSSTQACKVLAVDTDTGAVVASGRAAHPHGTEVDPWSWWSACRRAIAEATADLTEPVAAMSVAGQQHGMVVLDSAGEVIRPALLWNDTRSAEQARALIERDGARSWAERTGSVPVASFTVTKLAWLAEHEPQHADRVARVLLPHDWLTWQLGDRATAVATDRGDASGTGYFSPVGGQWLPELLAESFGGRRPELPRLLEAGQAAGRTPSGAVLGPGTGDNMAAALGLELEPGDVVVSLGTSGTTFAVTDRPTTDSTGTVAGFCDATGRFLPLVATLNAARVLTATARMLDTDLTGLDDLALQAPAGAEGLVLLPYLEGERTPNLPEAAGTLLGLRTGNMTGANMARAAVEGMLCGLADGVDALRSVGVAVGRVLLIGGAASSRAVRAVAPMLFDVPVEIPDPGEHVAFGAARQAAWALTGDLPVGWQPRSSRVQESTEEVDTPIRANFATARYGQYGM